MAAMTENVKTKLMNFKKAWDVLQAAVNAATGANGERPVVRHFQFIWDLQKRRDQAWATIEQLRKNPTSEADDIIEGVIAEVEDVRFGLIRCERACLIQAPANWSAVLEKANLEGDLAILVERKVEAFKRHTARKGFDVSEASRLYWAAEDELAAKITEQKARIRNRQEKAAKEVARRREEKKAEQERLLAEFRLQAGINQNKEEDELHGESWTEAFDEILGEPATSAA